MIANSPETSGFYDFKDLPYADTGLLSKFTTRKWSKISQLFVQENDGQHIYPYIADGFSGYIPNWGEGDDCHPLRTIESALSQDLHTTDQPLRLMSFQVGQIADVERVVKKIYPWEHEVIVEEYGKLKNPSLAQPNISWKRKNFVEYFAQIRAVESELLREQVIGLAGLVVAQNTEKQLYVAKLVDRNSYSGWLAPLIGLSVDPKVNGYSEQVHDVVAVVMQKDGVKAHMKGVTGNLYTAYAPREGVR